MAQASSPTLEVPVHINSFDYYDSCNDSNSFNCSNSFNYTESCNNSNCYNCSNSFNNFHSFIYSNYSNSFNNSGFFNQQNTVNVNNGIDNERPQILEWLSPLEPLQRHKSVRTDRLDGVGSWLLETDEFRKWRGTSTQDEHAQSVLFCSGKPGVGKTYLTSLVIDNLYDKDSGKDIAIAGLYCDVLAHEEQSATNMVGAILKQLIGRNEIPEFMRQAFQRAKEESGGRGLRLSDLVAMLKRTIEMLPQVFICIDALDESVPKDRLDLLLSLRDIILESPSTRIFFTGRPYVEDEIATRFNGAVVIPVTPNVGDIKSYLEHKLDRDTTPHAMNNDLRADIMRIIPQKISEIFLLVSLNIDAILGEITIYRRRMKLTEMINGKGLGDAYTASLKRVKTQGGSKSKLGMDVLMWIAHSERPLHATELCHAMGVEIGSTDINTENIPAIKTLLGCCLGLVTVEESSSTVRPVHFTLKEYLFNNPALFRSAHSMIAEVCLTYLNFKYVKDLSPSLASAPTTIPFVEYASHYWGTHAKKDTSKSVRLLALKLLAMYDNHISSKLFLLYKEPNWSQPFDENGSPKGFTGLHGAAYIGNVEITLALLELGKWDLNGTDFKGNTAFSWAAKKGHEGIVKILLAREDIDPNTADEQGGTPLSWAAENGHEGVVRILLDRKDISPDTVDKRGRTPLSWAFRNEHEGVVKMLLERNDVNPNTVDEKGLTALLWAAENGHEAIVKKLLERDDVNPNAVDEKGRTPLFWAAGKGCQGAVKMLLGRDNVNSDTADKGGRTPLLWAAENGHEETMKLLLNREDVNPDVAAKGSRTPLSWTAGYGHEAIVRILLNRKEVNPDTPDEQGRTPLSWAAENGHGGVARMLLEQSNVNPDSTTKGGRTPLSWAAENGCEEVVKMLLQRNDVSPDMADSYYGRTPLSWAAGKGHEGVVKMLLGRAEVNPGRVDAYYGRTPLSWAAGKGHEGVVKMFLGLNDVSLNTVDTYYGRTPLSWAAWDGYDGVVKMLLDREDVNPDAATKEGRTALSGAAENGHSGVVKMLLDREDVNPDIADVEGRTPLSWAAGKGCERVVEMLLDREEVNPELADAGGRTPLSWVTSNGHEAVVQIVLEDENLNPQHRPHNGRRHSVALVNSHDNIARLLLKRKRPLNEETGSELSTELRSSETSEPASKRRRMIPVLQTRPRISIRIPRRY